MLQFNSVILFNHKGVLLTAEKLDPKPDADGYVSFGISVDERDSLNTIRGER